MSSHKSELPSVVCTTRLGVNKYAIKCYDHVKTVRMIAGHLRVGTTYSGLYDRIVHLTWIQSEHMVREVNIT